MPPFIPRKRSASLKSVPPAKRQARTTIDPKIQEVIDLVNTSDSSSLSEADTSDEFEDVNSLPVQNQSTSPKGKATATNPSKHENSREDDDEDDDEDVDWEDAIKPEHPSTHTTTQLTTPVSPHEDLELTLDPDSFQRQASLLDSKKGPSKIEREIRLNTHRMHVQCLLFHNALRNAWISDSQIHEVLRSQLPAAIQKEIQSWRVASALDHPSSSSSGSLQPSQSGSEDRTGKKTKSSRKTKSNAAQSRMSRDWGHGAVRLEPGKPDMSRGDPIISLLRILAAYWKKRFKISAPGLRKRGYRPMRALEADIMAFQKEEFDVAQHGERIRDRNEFRQLAQKCEGSRDVGAQLFTALLRALGIEARLVANLQPLGFGWTKAEVASSKTAKDENQGLEQGDSSDAEEDESSGDHEPTPRGKTSTTPYDKDLPFPIYWTEVISPITQEVIPVDPMVLSNSVAAIPELVYNFEPRGARADKGKQVIAYVVAYSSDGTAKDVTTRYLRRRTWPGKTKGFRLPIEKIPLSSRTNGRTRFIEYDWFKVTMRAYERSDRQKTVVDDLEEAKDLVPNQPEKKAVKEGDTLQSLRLSEEFVLERFLRREEALRPNTQHVRMFMSGKGDKAKEEKVYLRKDVLKCLSAESWHKEGRKVRVGEVPLKRVPIRAVTLIRKRAVDELERETGEKPLQGLYARYQTEWIIPPPIENGVIPKNEYGNIDCFVPSMVPQGAIHIPYNGTVRVCRKLGVDFAEAVTGFEFGSKMAVPIISGVVVAEENAELVVDAWRADQKARREKERLQQEKRILQTWRKFLMGLRIAERVRAEYGDGGDAETHNPFAKIPTHTSENEPGADFLSEPPPGEDLGGGFLIPGQDANEDDFVVEHEPLRRSFQPLPEVDGREQHDDSNEHSSAVLSEKEEVSKYQFRGGNRR